MRKAIVSIIAALAVLVWAADRAQAVLRFIGKHSAADVQSACSKVGGSFSNESGSYGCTKNNCDGKGGVCVVQCDASTGGCVGDTPSRTVPKSIRGVLTGGQLAQPDRPSSRPPKPGTSVVTGGGLLDGGSGFGSQGPAATGSPLGGAAPPRSQGGGRVN